MLTPYTMGGKSKIPLPPGAPTEEDVREFLGEEVVRAMENRSPQHKWSLNAWTKACVSSYLGLGYSTSAGAMGVTRATIQNWMEECPKLRASLDHFKVVGTQLLTSRLWGFSSDNELTARWMLERRARDDFAPPVRRTEVTGADQGPVRVELHDADAPSDAAEVPPEISGEEDEQEEA